MPIERVKEFREVELDIDTDATTSVVFFTEMPNDVMTAVHTQSVSATNGRNPVNFRLPGSSKGKLCKVRITSTQRVIIYGAKVYCRYTGGNFPWGWAELPVEPTSALFSARLLPIEPTSEMLSLMALPIEQTPVNRIWVDIPVDAVA